MLIIESVIFLVGLAVLSWSADKFVFGASAIARNVGISPMIIGLTIVAMGSSAPEIMVSAAASLDGNTDTAIGNAIGSNITNIALVLGIVALIKPLSVTSSTLRREMPLLLVITLIAWYFLHDLMFTRIEGILLIIGFVLFIGWLILLSRKADKDDLLQAETEQEIPSDVPTGKALFWLIVGLILLPVSASYMVDSAVTIARHFGMSDLIIGLTIIALGTSLPELAASIAGAMKGEDDLALGNIIGSNIFNILAVMAMPGLIAPGAVDPAAASRDVYTMIGLSVLLIIFSFNLRGTRRINRYEGLAFIACYIGYQCYLFAGA